MSSHSYFSDVASLVRIASFKYHEAPAFAYQSSPAVAGGLSYADVDTASTYFAQYLTEELGMQRGERVAMMLPHCLAMPVVVLGVLRSGLVLVPIDPTLADEELVSQVRSSGASVFVVAESSLDRAWSVFEASSVRTLVTASAGDFLPLSSRVVVHAESLLRGLGRRTPLGSVSLREILRRMERSDVQVARWELSLPMGREVAMVRMGGVGPGLLVTHGEIARRVSTVAASFGECLDTAEDSVLSLLPQHRPGCFVSGFLSFFWLGIKNTLVDVGIGSNGLRSALERHRPTWMSVAADEALQLLKYPWAVPLLRRSVRGVIVEGAGDAFRDQWMRAVGVPVVDSDFLESGTQSVSDIRLPGMVPGNLSMLQ